MIQVGIFECDALSRDLAAHAALLVAMLREKAFLGSEKIVLQGRATRIIELPRLPFGLSIHCGYVAEVSGSAIGPVYPEGRSRKAIKDVAGTGEVIDADANFTRAIGDRFVVPL